MNFCSIFALAIRQKHGLQRSKHFAEIAQLVEHNLAKVGVASSSLVFRSTHEGQQTAILFFVRFAEESVTIQIIPPNLPYQREASFEAESVNLRKTLVLDFVTFVLYREIQGATAVGYNYVDCEQREKVSAFSLFLLPIVRSCQKPGVILQSNP